MLSLFIPSNAPAERKYIADVLLHGFLGLDIEIRPYEGAEVFITNGDQKRLVMDDSFFGDLHDPWLRKDKVPSAPLKPWRLAGTAFEAMVCGPNLPVLFGSPLSNGEYIAFAGQEIRLGLDILGSAFFMLSRYEEVVSEERDEYDRFPARASVAFRGGFLDRPLVNEYVEVLWACLQRLWSGLHRRERRFRMLLSHDVDQPFLLRNEGFSRLIRTMAGDALKRRNAPQAIQRPIQWAKAHVGGPEQDPAYTFNYIMDVVEGYGLKSAFYFIPSLDAGPPDYRYGMFHPDIRRLMSTIHARGHELGYHASIETFRDSGLIAREVKLLREACDKIGAGGQCRGSRQHYLRVQPPATLRYLSEAGLSYDTTLSFADHAGFRCGTCYEYPFYDLESRRPLALTERPLIVMECSVIDENYMGLGSGAAALDVMIRLGQRCKKYSGDFTVLWHNTRLVKGEERQLFERLLEQICGAATHTRTRNGSLVGALAPI